MLQMPAVNEQLVTDEDECRCPGYYQEQCEAEAAQGCVWSDAGESNEPWCQCGAVPTPVCCTAMTASCLSCQEGIDEDEYCARNPGQHDCPVTLPPPVEPTDPIPDGWTMTNENWNCRGSGSSVADHRLTASTNEECAQACWAEGHVIAALWSNNRNICRCYDDCDGGGATHMPEWPNTVMQKEPEPTGATTDGCPRDNTNSGNYGGPVGDMSGEVIPFSVSQSATDTASVRCCSTAGDACETSSLEGGCSALLEKTFAEAQEVCSTRGMRLCSRSEMDNNICCNSGCWFNHHAVWVDGA